MKALTPRPYMRSNPIIQGYKPSPFQRKIHDAIKSDGKYFSVCAGRQVGKTLLSINQMLDWSINDPGTLTFFCSPVYKQARKVFKELVATLKGARNIIKSVHAGDLIVTLVNGSSIQFHSLERYDNLRGYTVDYLIVDEAAFVKEEAWSTVLKAIVLVKGKKILLISTPKRKNWFYNIHRLGLSGNNPLYKSFKGTTYDNPLIDIQEIQDAKESLPDTVFKQEYLAEFIDGDSEVFKNIEASLVTILPIRDNSAQLEYFMGIDVGRLHDYTVATIINSEGDVVEIYRANKTSWQGIYNKIEGLIRKYKITTAKIEVNSIGDVVFEGLRAVLPNPSVLKPFTTTAASKAEIIEYLQTRFEQGSILINKEEQILIGELEQFTYVWNKDTRNIKYGAPSGLHDDCVMSLAIAFDNLRKKNRTSLPSF